MQAWPSDPARNTMQGLSRSHGQGVEGSQPRPLATRPAALRLPPRQNLSRPRQVPKIGDVLPSPTINRCVLAPLCASIRGDLRRFPGFQPSHHQPALGAQPQRFFPIPMDDPPTSMTAPSSPCMMLGFWPPAGTTIMRLIPPAASEWLSSPDSFPCSSRFL